MGIPSPKKKRLLLVGVNTAEEGRLFLSMPLSLPLPLPPPRLWSTPALPPLCKALVLVPRSAGLLPSGEIGGKP